ncbi:Uncharacterised protein [Mycobacterium tuberculosis]|nr:Uncharacterised protein [Mycobacterium tuberculosis]
MCHRGCRAATWSGSANGSHSIGKKRHIANGGRGKVCHATQAVKRGFYEQRNIEIEELPDRLQPGIGRGHHRGGEAQDSVGDVADQVAQTHLARGSGCAGLANSGGLVCEPGRIGDVRRPGQRVQSCGDRGCGRIAVHGRSVLGPHFAIACLGSRDGRHVLPKDVGRCQFSQQGSVGNHLGRGHCQRKRRFKGGRRRHGLCRRERRGFSGAGQPDQIGLHRGGHRQRCGTHPVLGAQPRDDRPDGGRSCAHLDSYAVPRSRSRQQVCRARAAIHARRIDLRR